MNSIKENLKIRTKAAYIIFEASGSDIDTESIEKTKERQKRVLAEQLKQQFNSIIETAKLSGLFDNDTDQIIEGLLYDAIKKISSQAEAELFSQKLIGTFDDILYVAKLFEANSTRASLLGRVNSKDSALTTDTTNLLSGFLTIKPETVSIIDDYLRVSKVAFYIPSDTDENSRNIITNYTAENHNL